MKTYTNHRIFASKNAHDFVFHLNKINILCVFFLFKK